ncbi:MAG: sigma-70 family RNA polymerase sigma factor [Eubacterium sp.]|nr:sigma-70 family RNA polymerase sigma factor [Eubacterium sp.]
MMTLKELRELVDMDSFSGNIPKKENLHKMGAEIVAKEVIREGTEIIVYKNGIVLYRDGKNATVFPMPEKKDYQYDGVSGSSVLDAEFFENENWYYRLIMEGEDRLAENQRRLYSNHSVYSYSLKGEHESADLIDDKPDMLDQMIREETIREIWDILTEKQKEIMYGVFFEEMSKSSIAKKRGVSQQAVSKMVEKCIRKVRITMGQDLLDMFIL